jgi:hypothetical protein
MACLVMKINKTVEISTYCISHSIICCLLHYYLYKSREMHLESICVVYIACYFFLYILTCLSPSSGRTIYKRKQVMRLYSRQFSLVCGRVWWSHSDELKHAGENDMCCKLYKFSPSAFCCWICISKMYHIYPVHYLNQWSYILNDRKNKHTYFRH